MAGWKRLALMGVLVALPIPTFAASGLAVPLPGVVYRAAAGIAERTQAVAVQVPGLGAVVSETTEVARRGTIRLSADELAAPSPPADSPPSPAADGSDVTKTKRLAVRRSVRSPRARVRRAAPAGPAARVSRSAAPAPVSSEPQRASDQPASGQKPTETRPSGQPAPSAATPAQSTDTRPKGETPGAPTTPPPAPPPPSPPASLPPLPVIPPADLPPAPVPVTPKAQLQAIADELLELAEARDAHRVEQAWENVDSAVERLAKSPPDKSGAIGDIKNAVQKLDAALADGEISLVERTLYVTRLNAVSQLLKAGQ